MNWKTEAIDKLRKFDVMRQAVRNIPEELTRLEIDAIAIRCDCAEDELTPEQLQLQKDALLCNRIQQQELERTLQQARLWLQTVSGAFSTLTPEEKMILTRLYIYREKGAVLRLSEELGQEQSTVYRKRDRALHKFTLALYGAAES